MDIKDAVKKYCKNKAKISGFCIPTDESGYWNINVNFLNSNNQEEQTQFDIKPADFDYGVGKCSKLVELWKGFCKDNSFRQNSVLSISIVGGWD